MLGMTILKTFFSISPYFCPNADSWASACFLVNVSSLSNTILTCSRCFPGCLQSCSTGAKGTKSANVGGPCTGNACTEDAGTENTSMEGACIQGTYLCGVYIGSACTLGTCVMGTYNGAIERSEIHL